MAQLAAVLGMLSAKGGHERWQHILPRHGGCPSISGKAASLPGRIVPVPRSITADCGLAWRCEPTLRGPVEALADPEEVMGIYELEI